MFHLSFLLNPRYKPEQLQEFYNKLTAAGVTTQLVVVHGGPHGLTAPNQSESRAQLTTLIVQFFAQHLK